MSCIKQSQNVGLYQLYNGKYVHKNQCRVGFGVVGGNDVSLYRGNMVDLENILMGLKKAPLPSGVTHKKTCQLVCYKRITG
jgi:hypothetical protein